MIGPEFTCKQPEISPFRTTTVWLFTLHRRSQTNQSNPSEVCFGLKAPSIRFSCPERGRCECALKEVLMSPQCECDTVYSDILQLPSQCHDVLGSSAPIFNSVCLRIASRCRISLFALYALHGVCKRGLFPVCLLRGRKQMCAITCVQPRR